MKVSDFTGAALFALIGLWWLAFPSSFCALYTRVHAQPREVPSPKLIRFLGFLWVAMVVAITLLASLDCLPLLRMNAD